MWVKVVFAVSCYNWPHRDDKTYYWDRNRWLCQLHRYTVCAAAVGKIINENEKQSKTKDGGLGDTCIYTKGTGSVAVKDYYILPFCRKYWICWNLSGATVVFHLWRRPACQSLSKCPKLQTGLHHFYIEVDRSFHIYLQYIRSWSWETKVILLIWKKSPAKRDMLTQFIID